MGRLVSVVETGFVEYDVGQSEGARMLAEFEERQFEAALNAELAEPSWIVFVPGQVFEAVVGIDAAFRSSHPLFWRWLGFPGPLPGRLLQSEIWGVVEESLRRFPPLQCNVFLQHKRPEHMRRRSSRQWSLWGRSYYRFETMAHQHATLMRLETAVGSNGVVLYSAPAFHRFDVLWQHITSRSLVDNFNFAQPSRLQGHSVYTYVQPGTTGRPNPDGEEVTSVDPRSIIQRFREEARDRVTPKEFILQTAETVQRAVRQGHDKARDAFDSLLERSPRDRPALGRAFDVMWAFCSVYCVSWTLPSRVA